MRPFAMLCLLVLTCLTLAADQATAITTRYTEDFTTTTYRDLVNTTALWDTVAGELKLPPYEITLVGNYDTPDHAYSVAIDGDYAYVADYTSGLKVLNIMSPASPSLAGSCDTPGFACAVTTSGDYAFVADGTSGLQVINITNPASPTLAGSCDTPDFARAIAISGDYAFVADGTSGLQVINITNPASPALVGSCDTPGAAVGVTISGDHAFVADGTSGLQVINITNPVSPTLAGSYNTPGAASGVAISGDYAYIADAGSGLQVLNITNPTSPTPTGSYPTSGFAYGVTVSGDYAYVANTDLGLLVLDITDPASPALAGSCFLSGWNARGVAIAGDYAYVAQHLSVKVLKIANLVGPMVAGSCDTPSPAWGVAISGDYAYVADGLSGLRVINITDPASPMLAGSYNTPDLANGVAVSGDYAYVADGGSGLQVINITDPANPTLAGSYDMSGTANGVAISGDYAYVAAIGQGVTVLNVTNPASPTLAGVFGTAYARNVAISGDYAYVASGMSGLLVLNITNPASPWLAGSYNTPGLANQVAISGDYAYVADGDSGLQVVNIRNPVSPALAGSYNTNGHAYSVAIDGDYAYVADGNGGLHVLNITCPDIPGLISSYDTPDYYAMDVGLSGDHAYVAGYTLGLQVMDVYQRRCKTTANIGRSLAIDNSDDVILKARLTSTQSDSIRWIVSANGGSTWTFMSHNNTWQTLSAAGSDLVWESIHQYVGRGVNPTCSDLTIEWLYSFPLISTVADVGNDQGRQASIEWTRNAYDFAGSTTPITEYAIFRRIDEVAASSSPANGEFTTTAGRRQAEEGEASITYPPGKWHFVMTVPADCEDSYAAVVPTLADSTESDGIVYTTFFVRARTATPGVYYDSPVDSGYSVDNLAPGAPGDLVMSSATALAWDESEAEDFDYFTVYGSGVPALDPTATLVGHTIGTTMDVAGDVYGYYHVTATDFSGNEGNASSVENGYAGVTPVEDLPVAFALKPSRPNPFSVRTSIGFDLPVGCAVRLRVYDAQGRQVKALADQAYPAGRHSVVWGGDDEAGNAVGSGIYFVRIEAGNSKATGKMLLAR